MDTTNQKPCQCEKASCGCAGREVERCRCDGNCKCSRICDCASGCRCGDAK